MDNGSQLCMKILEEFSHKCRSSLGHFFSDTEQCFQSLKVQSRNRLKIASKIPKISKIKDENF